MYEEEIYIGDEIEEFTLVHHLGVMGIMGGFLLALLDAFAWLFDDNGSGQAMCAFMFGCMYILGVIYGIRKIRN